jgi:hypothetical protein
MNRQLHFLSVRISSTGFTFETGSRLISDEWLIVGFKASLSTSYFRFWNTGDYYLFSSVIANSSKLYEPPVLAPLLVT